MWVIIQLSNDVVLCNEALFVRVVCMLLQVVYARILTLHVHVSGLILGTNEYLFLYCTYIKTVARCKKITQ